jgi:aspartyl-tRNA(Asn)/glutamyl-tRNA(Gln) amidotransferase subunit A
MASASRSTQNLTEIARRLDRGEATASDLAEAAIARHGQLDATLHAYKAWDPDKARLQARAADAALAAGMRLGPLQGLPVSVKDLYGIQGWPTFAGTPKRLPAKWEQDGPVIATLRRQLATVIGKTHTVELAFGGLGTNPHWGTPRNPWDATAHRVPGGSSSGAGVSLWEGSALLALGTDTAGSVRIPASFTGAVGLKTGAGRWSTEGIVPLSRRLDTPGMLALSVADAAYAFAALDPAWGRWESLEAQIGHRSVSDLRIGIAAGLVWDDCAPGIAESVQEALSALAAKGAKLGEASFPEAEEAISIFRQGGIQAAECDAFLAAELPEWRALIAPIVQMRIADGGAISARELLLRHRRMDTLALLAAERFEPWDVIALPTVPIAPPKVDEVTSIETYRAANNLALRNTCIANYLTLTALTLPAGLDSLGLPAGLMLLAPHGAEERLLSVALAAERILGSPRQRLGSPPLAPAP